MHVTDTPVPATSIRSASESASIANFVPAYAPAVGRTSDDGRRRALGLPTIHYPGNVTSMAIAQSKVTAQGQISVPAEVRKKLGVGPGSVLEWDEQDDQVVVRRAARYTSQEVHDALFPEENAEKGPVDVNAGIRKYMRKRHARR